jgi:hypothetical protein
MEMTPAEIRDILYAAKPEEFYKLPYDVMNAVGRRPPEDKYKQAKRYMYFRASLIAILTIYVYMHYSCDSSICDDIRSITFIVIGYEIAYYNLRTDTLKSEYYRALDDYLDVARTYIKGKYPEL